MKDKLKKPNLKALVLAGGYDQIALIKELKKREYEILLADYLENPPAKGEADFFAQISTLDEDKIYELAKKERVNLIITACTDQALLTAANVAEKLGLPFYLNGNQARNVTNKFYMKQKFKEYGIPSADYRMYENEDKIELSALKNFPYVVKPCDCNSSKGVIKTNNSNELEAAIKNAFRLSRSKKVVVEQYVSGKELSIDLWIDSRKPQILAVSETRKMNIEKGIFTIYQSLYPAGIDDLIKQKIILIATQICDAFELERGPMLIQAILHNREIYVLEFSARMGGGSKYKFIQYVSGVDIMDQYVSLIVDSSKTSIKPRNDKVCCEMDYVYAYPGIVNEFEGIDELKKKEMIEEVFYYKEKGTEITQKAVSGDRVIGFLIGAESPGKLIEKRTEMLNKVKILDPSGRDIMYRECFIQESGVKNGRRQ